MSIPSKLVAITGASGFLGSEIALEALRQGYRVRLVARKQTQADAFREKYSAFAAKVESVVVADIEAEGGLDEAVKGSDAFIHSASPVSDGSYVRFPVS
jgi:nucleoside-diphosphate-sugar epimerase